MRRWDIYWADYPYEETPGISKRRPVIIANDKAIYVLVLKVTSKAAREYDQSDYELKFWREAGLSAASVVRVQKIARIAPDAIYEYIGRVHAADILAIQHIMKDIKDARDIARKR